MVHDDVRRRVLAAIGAAAVAPMAWGAAQPASGTWRVGILSAASAAGSLFTAFLQGMRDLGYVEGVNLQVEQRFADGQYERLPGLARELVARKVDIIVVSSSPAIRAARQATSTIPIVFPNTSDPVASGFAQSLSRPGLNMTGLMSANSDISGKMVELLRMAAPKAARVAALGNPGSASQPVKLANMQAAGKKAAMQVISVPVHTPDEVARAFAAMARDRIDAVIIQSDSLLLMQRRQIAAFTNQQRLPSIAQDVDYPAVGGLMGYGQDLADHYRMAATYVDKIFKGARPGELPIEQPMRLTLAINRGTAAALGLTIPAELLLRADRVLG
jgi:putative ABC transport system substrate-binding protein